jgi:hypothetical protein
VKGVSRVPTLDEVIEEFRTEHGFSNEAWDIYREAVGQSAELAHRIETLEKKVKALERRPGYEYPARGLE